MTKYIETTADCKNALKRLTNAHGKLEAEFRLYGIYIAEQTLMHGNKQPLQLAESSGLRKYMVQALKRMVLPQNVKFRTEPEAAREVAIEHADKVIGMVMDKKQDESDDAKKKRAEAKKKREAEKKRVADLEAENVKLKQQHTGEAFIADERGKAMKLTAEEYAAAVEAVAAFRKAQEPVKAVASKRTTAGKRKTKEEVRQAAEG